MGAGKTLDLLKAAYNYEERDIKVLLFTSDKDNRYGTGVIQSRTGLSKQAIVYGEDFDFITELHKRLSVKDHNIGCILIDEAQFLTAHQVNHLAWAVDRHNIPIICYGLRVRYTGLPFPGSSQLMAIADSIEEIKTICHCGKKATMNALVRNGEIVYEGEDVIDNDDAHKDNTFYVSVCRNHWHKGIYKKTKD